MNERMAGETVSAKYQTVAERISDCEMVVTRTFDGPARLVFAAWTTPSLLMRWWVPEGIGMTMLSCEVDARVGGAYRFVFDHPEFPEPMAFFGKYLEVVPNSRLVWTNEESAEGAVSTLTFKESGGKTLLTLSELHPSKEALDAALEMGNGFPQQFEQLDALLLSQAEETGQG